MPNLTHRINSLNLHHYALILNHKWLSNGFLHAMVDQHKDKANSFNTQWKNSLTFKFTIAQFVVAAMIIASSIWLIFSTEKKHHMDTQLSLSQHYGLAVIEQLQQVTSKIETLAHSIGIVGETYQGDRAIIHTLVPPLLDIGERHRLIAGGGIWPEPGAFGEDDGRNSFFWARDEHDEFQYLDSYNNLQGPAYHQAFWYQPAKYFQDNHTHWSKSYIDPYTKEIMITASVPMRADHRFIGVATVDIALKGLDQRFNFSDQNPLSKGYILALDSYNNLLANPFDDDDESQKLLGQPLTNLLQEYPELSDIGQAITQMDDAFYTRIMTNPAYKSQQLTQLLEQTPQHERRRLMALINASILNNGAKPSIVTLELSSDPIFNEPVLVSILTMAKTQWKIILVTPQSSLSQQANAIALKIGAFLLLSQLLALLILFVFQHKLFIKPIFQIVSALQSGNLGRLELDANKRQDEVGQLAKAFIARSNQLEVAYASLDASNLALEQQLAMQHIAQLELKNKKELINSLLNASQNLICIKDTCGTYSLVNDKFCEVLGIERSRIIGAKDSELYPEHIAHIIAGHDAIIISSDNAQSFEQPMPTVHGERTYLITKYPIKDKDDNLIALGAMAVDISSLKAKQRELEQTIDSLSADKKNLKQALAANTIESTATEVMTDTSISDIKQFEYEQQKLIPQVLQQLLRQELQSLEQIFIIMRQMDAPPSESQLSSFAENLTGQIDIIRHTQMMLSTEVTDIKSTLVDQFLEHLVAMLTPKLDSKSILVTIDSLPHLAVPVPTWHLFILSYRLIGNSLHHAFPSGQALNRPKQLTVSVTYQDHILTLKIRDNGIGIGVNKLKSLQGALTNADNGGTLMSLNSWLKHRYKGELTITSQAAQFTEVTCRLSLNP